MEYYWELIQRDGTRTRIPPSAVEMVKRRWDNGQPIHTTNMSIPANQIQSFNPTSELYGQVPLLEAASQAFHEPILNEDGSMVCRWVKKPVTQKEYQSHYGKIPAYRNLGGDGNMITVAFFLPVQDIDASRLSYCTPEEEERLERERKPTH